MEESANIAEPNYPQDGSIPINLSLTKIIGTDLSESEGLVVKTRCKVCNSPFRHEAEKMFEARAQCQEIKAFLDSKGLVIHPQNIRNHMLQHYKNRDRMAALAEYVMDIQSALETRKSRIEDLEMLIEVAKKEMFLAISIPTEFSLSKEKERNEMIFKAHKSMLDSIKALNEMEDGEAKARAIQVQFANIWKEKIAGAKSEEERLMLTSMLADFKKSWYGTQSQEGKK